MELDQKLKEMADYQYSSILIQDAESVLHEEEEPAKLSPFKVNELSEQREPEVQSELLNSVQINDAKQTEEEMNLSQVSVELEEMDQSIEMEKEEVKEEDPR